MMLTIRARVTTTSVEGTSQSRCVGMLIASATRETCCTRSQLLLALLGPCAREVSWAVLWGKADVPRLGL
jgi:hypothetical protein